MYHIDYSRFENVIKSTINKQTVLKSVCFNFPVKDRTKHSCHKNVCSHLPHNQGTNVIV